jgi:ATP-binding protein involved in chromosome partitioning
MTGEELAKQYGMPFLGSIPLDPEISHSSDQGEPALVAYPESDYGKEFRAIAGRLAAEISVRSMA